MTGTATTVAPDDSAVQRLADRLADEFEALVVAAMERVADRFLGDVIADAAPIDEADTRAIIALWAQETPELVAALAEMHATIAAETIARYGPPAADSLVEALRLSYLDRATPRMTDIGTSLWESSVKTLAEGHAAGEDYRQLRDRLRLTFAADGKELSESRAARIARTEVHAAVNAGTLDGMKALPSDIKPRYKTWLATQDGRTREDHAAADGQTVQLEATFLVAGEQLAHPGDPMGSAGNVIHCRCKVVYGDNPDGPQLDERQLGYDDYDEEDFDVPVGAEADADAGANDDVAFMALSPLERVLKTVSQIDELPRRDDGGDVFLQAINDVRLNNRLPHAVTHDEIDHLVADDGYREVWRGVNGTSRTPASEYVDQFLTGDHYPGLGVHGNGTYTSTIRSTAESYGEGLIRIAIPPDARIIDVNDLADLREQAKSEWLAVRGSYDSNTQRLIDNILWEPGRFAAAAGYDGFTVAQTVTNPDELYVIVLNRAMLFVTRGSART